MSGSRALIGVAIAVPEPWKAEIEGWRSALGDPQASSIPAHITLLPPTAVDEVDLDEIEKHLRDVAEREAPYDVHLRGTGTFRPVSPVVFVALASGIAGCEALEQRVRSGRLARGLDFPYHPHVTVAHDLPDDVLDRAYDGLADFSGRFTVTEFSLYRHGTDGVWHVRQSFALGG